MERGKPSASGADSLDEAPVSEGQPLLLELGDVAEQDDEKSSAVKRRATWCRKHKREVVIGIVVGLLVGIVLAIPAAFLVDPIRGALRTKPYVFSFPATDVTFKSATFSGNVIPNGLKNLWWKFVWDVASSETLRNSTSWTSLSTPAIWKIDELQPGVEYSYQLVVQQDDSIYCERSRPVTNFTTDVKPNGTLTVGGCWSNTNASGCSSLFPAGVGQTLQWLGTPDGKYAYLAANSSLWKVDDAQVFSPMEVVVGASSDTVFCTNNFLYTLVDKVLNAYPIVSGGDLGNVLPNIANSLSLGQFVAVTPNDRCVVSFQGASVTVGCRENTSQDFQFSANGKINPFSVDKCTSTRDVCTPFAVGDDVFYVFAPADKGFKLGVWSLSTLKRVQCFSSDPSSENCARLPQIAAPLSPINGVLGDNGMTRNADIEVNGDFLLVSQFYQYPSGLTFVVNFVFHIGTGGLLNVTENFCYTSLPGTTCTVLPGEFNSKWFFSRDAKSFYAFGTTGLGGTINNLPNSGTAVVQGLFTDAGEVVTVPPPFGCVGLLSSSANSPPCNQTLPAGGSNPMLGYFYQTARYFLVTEKVVYFQNMWFRRE